MHGLINCTHKRHQYFPFAHIFMACVAEATQQDSHACVCVRVCVRECFLLDQSAVGHNIGVGVCGPI